jgi:hypothetical protein
MLATLMGAVCIVAQAYGASAASVRIVAQSSSGTTFEVGEIRDSHLFLLFLDMQE